MNKPAIYKTALAALLVVCLGFDIYLHLSLAKTRSLLDNYVPIEKYNQLVQAESNNVTALNGSLKAQRARLQAEQNQAQTLLANLMAKTAQLEALTNLYEKTDGLEIKMSETEAERGEYEGRQAFSISRMGSKVDALEKAVIKLSLAVQENQFSISTNDAAKTQTNAAP